MILDGIEEGLEVIVFANRNTFVGTVKDVTKDYIELIATVTLDGQRREGIIRISVIAIDAIIILMPKVADDE